MKKKQMQNVRINMESLRKVIRESGLSANTFARAYGISQSAVLNWLKEDGPIPRLSTIEFLADQMKMPVDFFILNEESENKMVEVSKCQENVGLGPSVIFSSIKPDGKESESIIEEEVVEDGVVQSKMIIERPICMKYRKLTALLEAAGEIVPIFAYETGFSKQEMEAWKKVPYVLSEQKVKILCEYLKIDPEALELSEEEKELDLKAKKFAEELPTWNYSRLKEFFND